MSELSIKVPIIPELTFLRVHQCGYVQMPHLEDSQLRDRVWFSGKFTVILLRSKYLLTSALKYEME